MFHKMPNFASWGKMIIRYPHKKKAFDEFLRVLSPDQSLEFVNLVFSEVMLERGIIQEAVEIDPWTTYTLEDAFKPRPPIEYVVDGLFPESSLSIMYGAPGVMKSLLLADMVTCVAAGKKWLASMAAGSVCFSTRQSPVLWIDCDNGVRRTHERFEALARSHGLSPQTPLSYVSMPNPPFDATDAEQVDLMIKRVLWRNAKLVVIDNLGTISGKADENSAQMIDVMANLRKLAEKTGAAVIVIHHQRKGSGSYTGRKGDTLRGHSSIEAAIDLALLVERAEHSQVIQIRATKERGAPVSPFGAEFVATPKPGSHELETARFVGRQATQEDSNSDSDLVETIIAMVSTNRGINQLNLRKQVKAACPGASDHRIRSLIDGLVKSGELTCQTGEHNARVYQINGE